MNSYILNTLISETRCVEVLAYVSYSKGCDEQIRYNNKLYYHVNFAKQAALSNPVIFKRANELKKYWIENPESIQDFLNEYNLESIRDKLNLK